MKFGLVSYNRPLNTNNEISMLFFSTIVDGRHPASVDMVNIPLFTGFQLTSGASLVVSEPSLSTTITMGATTPRFVKHAGRPSQGYRWGVALERFSGFT